EARAGLPLLACPLEPTRWRVGAGRDELGGRAVILARLEDRVAAIAGAAAAGAIRQLVGLLHRELRAADEAEERALAGGCSGLIAIVERGVADAVEDGGPPSCVPASTLARPRTF